MPRMIRKKDGTRQYMYILTRARLYLNNDTYIETNDCLTPCLRYSERFIVGTQPRLAWPPFLIAQEAVLGKDCTLLRERLEHPIIDEAKAFGALTQLDVLVRLL
jgi:hypothetical protein